VASRDVRLSRSLADGLPATRKALADGDVSIAHAQMIASLWPRIGGVAMEAAEPHIVDLARQSTTTEFREVVSHVVHSYAPERFAKDESSQYDERQLHASTTMYGVGVGQWELHPLGHETVMSAIHAASRPVVNDDRTPAQRRADALVTIADIALRSGELPISGGVKPHVSIHVRPETLQGAEQAPGAELGSGAVVGTNTARRLTCDGDIARIVFGPKGEILDSGRSTRTFSSAQVRAIVARDRHCIWLGCDAPANWSDVHHRVHWADGGTTSVQNGVLLCGRHHDRMHYTDAAIIDLPDGRVVAGPRFDVIGPGYKPRTTFPEYGDLATSRAGP
jgi:hypothetical protein